MALSPCLQAGGEDNTTLGLMGGPEIFAKAKEDISSVQAYIEQDLPWSWTPGNWGLKTRMQLSAGLIYDDEVDSFITALGPVFQVSRQEGRLALELGTRVAYMESPRMANLNLGGHLQFISHVGLHLRTWKQWRLGLRFEHLSNSSVNTPNPGLETLNTDLSFSF